MTGNVTGWASLIVGLGAMATLASGDLGALGSWSAALTPAFIAKMLAHFGVVVGVWAGARQMDPWKKVLPSAETEKN